MAAIAKRPPDKLQFLPGFFHHTDVTKYQHETRQNELQYSEAKHGHSWNEHGVVKSARRCVMSSVQVILHNFEVSYWEQSYKKSWKPGKSYQSFNCGKGESSTELPRGEKSFDSYHEQVVYSYTGKHKI